MNQQTDQDNTPGDSPGKQAVTPAHEQVEEYGSGHIKARHGRINVWLLVVYAVLFIWALYYGYTYWGGLGPGLDY